MAGGPLTSKALIRLIKSSNPRYEAPFQGFKPVLIAFALQRNGPHKRLCPTPSTIFRTYPSTTSAGATPVPSAGATGQAGQACFSAASATVNQLLADLPILAFWPNDIPGTQYLIIDNGFQLWHCASMARIARIVVPGYLVIRC
jgi:hypothetical protein